MTEFTYNGIVRYGFGFYNPNHAAALICALFPFFWNWKRLPFIGWLLSFLLIIPLYLTCSRTGFLVLIMELIISIVISKCRFRKFVICFMFAMVIAVAISPLGARFILDDSLMNRTKIWLSGLRLFASNPFGVGFGNSGELVSTFLLDGITSRTLVNAHLTLLVEGGIFLGFLWIIFIIFALISGDKKSPMWCSFFGLTISAFMSTVFDFTLLCDFKNFGRLSLFNFILSWFTFVGYLWMGITLLVKSHSRFNFILSFMLTVLMCLMPFPFKMDSAPYIHNGSIVKYGENMSVAIRDNDWRIKDVLPFMKSGYMIPIKTFDVPNKIPSNAIIWLFGNAVEYAQRFQRHQLILVAPPHFFELPKNTEKVYIKKFIDERNFNCKIEYY